MVVDTATLSKLSYFAGLPPAELEFARQSFFEKNVPRGDLIFMEEEPADSLYFLISGVVKLFKTSAQGKEQIISLARPGDVLNDISIFDGGPNEVSAQSVSPVLLYGIKKERFDSLMQKYPQMTGRIVKALAAHTRQLITLVEDLSFKHVPGRVAKILLQTIGNDGAQRLTQQEMANMAGTAREVVARSLKALDEQGLIKMERHSIIILDKSKLTKLAEEAV
ncbi:MAG TPA: Crp/Fnr family transcriptional regulator [Dehalococcoidales bacterium]|nr:Crp/Fnr family transcriptional regulator [Dehalococcoidales bacterium]